MDIKINTLNLGFDQCYLIQSDNNTILIDAGAPNKKDVFLKYLEELNINPNQIKLVIITHGHWDHIGSAKDIKELTGAKIAMHEKEKDWIENSINIHPPGITRWGNIFGKIMPLFNPFIKIAATEVDIVLNQNRFNLKDYGIPGFVEHTPGHSPGSVSIILETGEAFAGDLLMNKFPLRLSPGFPIFGDDVLQVKQSLEKLQENGVKTIYPAHGKPFSAEVIEKELIRLMKYY